METRDYFEMQLAQRDTAMRRALELSTDGIITIDDAMILIKGMQLWTMEMVYIGGAGTVIKGEREK